MHQSKICMVYFQHIKCSHHTESFRKNDSIDLYHRKQESKLLTKTFSCNNRNDNFWRLLWQHELIFSDKILRDGQVSIFLHPYANLCKYTKLHKEVTGWPCCVALKRNFILSCQTTRDSRWSWIHPHCRQVRKLSFNRIRSLKQDDKWLHNWPSYWNAWMREIILTCSKKVRSQ